MLLENLHYKGSRSYIHSSSIFEAIEKSKSKILDRSCFIELLEIRRQINFGLQISEISENCVGRFVLRSKSGKGFEFGLIQSGGLDGTRTDDRTVELNEFITRDNKTISGPLLPFLSVFETAIYLTKRLHEGAVFGSQTWHFVKFCSQSRLPDLCDAVTVNQTRRLGVIMTINELLINDMKIGEIHFFKV